MPISPNCPECGKKHRSRFQQYRCETKSKKYPVIIEMEQCPHCESYQEEPAKLETFNCLSCGGVAV